MLILRSSIRVLGILIWIGLAGGQKAGAQPGAYELLAKVQQTYEELEGYRDLGTIEQTFRGDSDQQTSRLSFETVMTADGFRWQLENEETYRVLWRDGPQGWSYDRALKQYRPVDSLASELIALFGGRALDALVVPALLLGSSGVLEEPEGASVDGPETCAESSCWILTLSRMAGTVESTLWIDRESFLIRRVEVQFWPVETITGALPVDQHAKTLTVEHEGFDDAPTIAELAFVPPVEAELVEEFDATARAEAEDLLPEYGFFEEITVDNASIVVRALDRSGYALSDLAATDFVAMVGKQEIPVTALDWISPFNQPVDSIGKLAEPSVGLAQARARAAQPHQGRLFVLFVQADFNAVRIRGHLRLRHYVEKEFLPTLHPNDWVAVLTFDSHLKLWHDFTRDRESIAETLHRAIRFGGRPLVRRNRRGPSILDSFSVDAGREIAYPEDALRVTGEALQPLPGEKDVIYLGWGLGSFDYSGVRMKASYWPAVRALQSARATVYSLDATDTDVHDLEVGMQRVSSDTGGTYHKTNSAILATRATRRLAATLRGYYILTLYVTNAPDGKVKLKLRHEKGELLYRRVRIGAASD